MVVLKRGFKSAMITVELAISLVLVLVVLFFTLGLFGNNLKDMFASSNFKNVFNGEDVKTFFAMFNRNYSNSQIDIQLLGQQGLQVVRKKANNGSLGILDAKDVSLTVARIRSTSWEMVVLSNPFMRSPKATLSKTFMCGKRA